MKTLLICFASSKIKYNDVTYVIIIVIRISIISIHNFNAQKYQTALVVIAGLQ